MAYVQSLTVGPDGQVERRYLRVGIGEPAAGTPISKQAYAKARAGGHRCIVEVLTPVEADLALATWLGVRRHFTGIRWTLPQPGAKPPAILEEAATAIKAAPPAAGLDADLLARAACDIWAQKCAEIGRPAPQAWDEIPDQQRLTHMTNAAHLLRVITRAYELAATLAPIGAAK